MSHSTYLDHERVEIRRSAIRRECWSWQEDQKAPGDGYDGAPSCTRGIAVGEQYVFSTIYPGHDSGYAQQQPFSTAHCLPCAQRWVNLRRGLEQMAADRFGHGEVTE